MMFIVIASSKLNMLGFMHSEARSNFFFVASCGVGDPAAHMIVCSTTLSARSGIVWISTLPLAPSGVAPGLQPLGTEIWVIVPGRTRPESTHIQTTLVFPSYIW